MEKELLEKIKKIIYNDKITGIEAKLMIKDLFEKENDDDCQDECKDFDEIVYSDDLEKYRQVNGSLNDKGNKIFCQRVNRYLDKKGSDK